MDRLLQPNGKRQGKPFRFTPSQVRFILWWYAVDENGDFIYRRACRRLAKGSGKSPFAAVLAIIEFIGPCRFDGFDDSIPGGCRAKRVAMPLVQIVATSEAQTENTFRMVRAFLPKGGRVAVEYGLDIGKTQIFLPPEGKLMVCTSSPTTMEGNEATFAVADETEHWLPNNGGHELLKALDGNLGKSGSRYVETCNAWKSSVDSVAEATFDAWIEQESGRSIGKTKILYDSRIAPPDTNMADPESLRAALEFVYDDCYWTKPEWAMERIYDPGSDPADSERKYLNWPNADKDSWCDPIEWAGISDPNLRLAPGDRIALGFDGSLTGDATVLVATRISDGAVFLIGAWEPTESGNPVPVEVVNEKVAWCYLTFEVVAHFCDVAYWESFVKIHWPQQYGSQIKTWARKGGKDPQPMAYDLRGNQFEWIRAVELTLREIKQGDFQHDDAEVLNRHVCNTMIAETRYGTGIRKRSKNSPDKIDGTVAMILSRLARRMYIAEHGDKPKRRGRVW